MKLITIGSGSTGNCYILKNENESLFLECGCPWKDALKGIDYQVSKNKGCLITHIHGDHCKCISKFMRGGVRTFSSDETQAEIETIHGEKTFPLIPNKSYLIGGFTVQTFELDHDVACIGYLIRHKEFGKLLYITDTKLVPHDFSKLNVNHVLVECNYIKENIDQNYYTGLKDRVFTTHMDLETTKKFISSVDSPDLYNVILCHMSEHNADEKRMIQEVSECTYANVFSAHSTKDIELLNSPF